MKIHSPFRTALVATLGVGLGIMLLTSVQMLSTVLPYVGAAHFRGIGLDPLVTSLELRGFPRWAAVLPTILGVLGVFTGIVLIVLPVVIDQISQLVTRITVLVINQDRTVQDLK